MYSAKWRKARQSRIPSIRGDGALLPQANRMEPGGPGTGHRPTGLTYELRKDGEPVGVTWSEQAAREHVLRESSGLTEFHLGGGRREWREADG
jgi:hypothetical protein